MLPDDCKELRAEIKRVAEKVVSLRKTTPVSQIPPHADPGEVFANLTIAYRHLEDAAMRVGKAIQAHDGGKSIYDA